MINSNHTMVFILSDVSTIGEVLCNRLSKFLQWKGITSTVIRQSSNSQLDIPMSEVVIVDASETFSKKDLASFDSESMHSAICVEYNVERKESTQQRNSRFVSDEIFSKYLKVLIGRLGSLQISSKGVWEHSDYPILQFFERFNPEIKEPVFLTMFFGNSSDRGSAFSDWLRKTIKDQAPRIYASTEKHNIAMLESLLPLTREAQLSLDMRERGAYLLKALDEKESGFELSGLTYGDLKKRFLNNPGIEKEMKNLGLNTDAMCDFEVNHIILQAHKELEPEFNYTYPIEENALHDRLSSVILELLSHSEPKIVIANPAVNKTLLQYFTNKVTRLPDTDHIVVVTPAKGSYQITTHMLI